VNTLHGFCQSYRLLISFPGVPGGSCRAIFAPVQAFGARRTVWLRRMWKPSYPEKRRMKKLLCFLVSMAVLCVFALPAAAKMTWKCSTFFDENHALTKGALKFKEEIEKKHGDEVEIKIYTLSQLGSGRENMEGLQAGTLELAEGALAYSASFTDAFFPLTMPYLFLTRETAYKILDGEIGQRIAKRFEEQTGVKMLGYWENGIRHVTNSKKQVKVPADLKDMKIRVMQDPVYLAMFRALGANPTPMDFGEVFTALQQGVIDGQENPYANMVQRKFYEVQKYLSTTAHIYDISGFYINQELFDSLDAQFQQDILDAAKAATEVQRREAVLQDDSYLKVLQDYGKMELTFLTPEERAVFKQAMSSVYDEVQGMLTAKDPQWAKIIPEMLAKIAEVEK
jgi:tripartite ATP-independent transporter DctP family solute receptor